MPADQTGAPPVNRTPLSLFDAFDTLIRTATSAVLFVIGLFLIAVLCLSVVGRYLLDLPLAFIEETSRILLVWFFMLGIGLAYRKKAHVAVELFVERLSKAWKNRIAVLANLAGIAFVAHLAAGGILGLDAASRQIEPTLGISGLWAASAVPCGAVLLIYHQLRLFIEQMVGSADTGTAR